MLSTFHMLILSILYLIVVDFIDSKIGVWDRGTNWLWRVFVDDLLLLLYLQAHQLMILSP